MNEFKKIIIKLGTSSLTQGTDGLCRRFMLGLVQQIAALQANGIQCILVSSGAVATGRSLLCHSHPKPVLASVGQVKLMQIWSELFSLFDLQVGQILLTRDDFSSNKKETAQVIEGLLRNSVIPVLNENDSTSSKESRIGDNDNLAVLAGKLIEADLIVLLTDQEGLYTANPRLDPDAKLIAAVDRIDEALFALAKGASSQGTGGMATKLEAARLAFDADIRMVIAHSSRPNVLIDLVQGLPVGTLFKRKP